MLPSPVKWSSCLNQETIYPQICSVYKQKQSKTVLNKCVSDCIFFYVRGQQRLDFFLTGDSIIIDYGLVFWPEVTV